MDEPLSWSQSLPAPRKRPSLPEPLLGSQIGAGSASAFAGRQSVSTLMFRLRSEVVGETDNWTQTIPKKGSFMIRLCGD
jgi:hypothetical protein